MASFSSLDDISSSYQSFLHQDVIDGERGFSVSLFTQLWSSNDPMNREFALIALERALREGEPTEAQRALWAALLPAELSGLWPISMVRVAHLYASLHPWHPTKRFPRGVEETGAGEDGAAVENAWLRARLLVEPAQIVVEVDSAAMLQALEGLSFSMLPYPIHFLREICKRDEAWYQRIALRLVDEGLALLALTPRFALSCVEAIFWRATPALQRDILAKLAEAWALCCRSPSAWLRAALQSEDLGVRREALYALDRWGDGEGVSAAFYDTSQPPSLRCAAMELVGRYAQAPMLDDILGLCVEDPLYYGSACFESLQRFHQRGIFVRPEHLERIFSILGCFQGISAALWCRVLFPCRRAIMAWLDAKEDDDPTWSSWLPILAALPLPAQRGARILRLLRHHRESSLCLPILEVIEEIALDEAEEDILSLLERYPRLCLRLLRKIGGEATTQRLAALLGILPRSEIVDASLVPYQSEALTLLWQLTDEDDSMRQAILEILDPYSLPPAILADLSAFTRPPVFEVIADEALEQLHAHQALLALSGYATPADLPKIKGLLLRHIHELHAGDLPPEGHRIHQREAEPTLYSGLKEAIQALGQRWHQQQKIRPRCLLSTANPFEAGDRLFSSLLLALLQEDQLTLGEQGIALEALASCHDPAIIDALLPRLRTKEIHLRKRILRCLTAQRAPGLLFNLGRLLYAEDHETIRQAILALVAFQARQSAHLVAACLEHPNMNIKKTAAEALCTIGTPQIVGRLLHYLSIHENPGFRTSLLNALHAILGSMLQGALLSAIEEAKDERQEVFLFQALSFRITLAQLREIVRCELPIAQRLLSALASGALRLNEEEDEPLRAFLTRYEIAIPEGRFAPPKLPSKRPPPPRPEAERFLLLEGWSKNAACAWFAAAPKPNEITDQLVKRMLREILHLLPDLSPKLSLAALRLLLHPKPSHWSAPERRLWIEKSTALTKFFSVERYENIEEKGGAHDEEAIPRRYGEFLELLLAFAPAFSPFQATHLVAALRAIPIPSQRDGGRYLALLQALGALLSRADLERALAACSRASESSRVMRAILGDALSLPTLPREQRESPSSRAFTQALDEAIRLEQPHALAALRQKLQSEPLPKTSLLLAALADAYPHAHPLHQSALLDWMLQLQPLGLSAWRAREDALAAEAAQARYEMRAQKREAEKSLFAQEASLAKLHALLALLEKLDAKADTEVEKEADTEAEKEADTEAALHPSSSPLFSPSSARSRGNLGATDSSAATATKRRSSPPDEEGKRLEEKAGVVLALLRWPHPLEAHGVMEKLIASYLGESPSFRLPAAEEQMLARGIVAKGASLEILEQPPRTQERILSLLQHLSEDELSQVLPHLFALWRSQDTEVAQAASRLLRRLSGDLLLPYILEAWQRGQREALSILLHSTGGIAPSVSLDRLLSLLRIEDEESADLLRARITRCGLRTDQEREDDLSRWKGLFDIEPRASREGTSSKETTEERAEKEIKKIESLFSEKTDLASLRAAARALTAWKHRYKKEIPSSLFVKLIQLVQESDGKARLIAHRLLRQLAPKERYLECTLNLLHDPRPDIQRSAIKTLAHARYKPAIQPLVDLLTHRSPALRAAAAKGLVLYEENALSSLSYALRHARPDQRGIYEAVIQAIHSTPLIEEERQRDS